MNPAPSLARRRGTTHADWVRVSLPIALLVLGCLTGTTLGQTAPPPLPNATNSTNAQPATPNLSPSAQFDRGNQFYDAGKFTEAAAVYQDLLARGQTSPALCFNLGNAWFKDGQLGRAIAAYRQAERLAPRDPDLRANLKFARAQVQGSTLTPGWAERLLSRLSLNEWTWAAVASVWAWLGLLTLRQLAPNLKRSLHSTIIAGAIITLLLCAGLGAALHQDRYVPTAVVISRDAVVRQGPLDEAKSVFTVHDGAELAVLDQKEGWLQVSTDSTHIGWVRRDQVVLAGALGF